MQQIVFYDPIYEYKFINKLKNHIALTKEGKSKETITINIFLFLIAEFLTNREIVHFSKVVHRETST